MLNIAQARSKVEKTFPNCIVETEVDFGDLYVFEVLLPLEGEAGFDPFFSVNKENGDLLEVSVMTDWTPKLTEAFAKAKGLKIKED